MKIFFFLVFLFIAGIGVWYLSLNQQQISLSPTPKASSVSPTITDYTASFAIFTNGTFRVFTAAMYHNLSEDAYIQADNPNIVHIKKPNTTWGDFFQTLPFTLTKDCLTTGTGQTFCTNERQSLKFYINGKREPNALKMIINPGDKLLVSYGNANDPEITYQLQQIPKL